MNKKKWISLTIVAVLVTNTITLFGTKSYIQNNSNIGKFYKLFQVESALYKYYDGNINESDLVEGAIKGMTSALNDPYTVFMNKKEFDEFNTQTEGNYSGVGLQVQAKDDKIIIADIFEDSPAKKAGLLPKDEIEKVNNTDVSGKDLDRAVTLMKGKEGTEVTLTMNRAGKGVFDVKLKRAKINLVTVKGEMVDKNVGYIQISMFDENTAKNLQSKLSELQGKGMKSLIIDLRGNPGGLLNECVDMVSNFLPKDKVIVSTIDKYKNKKEYKSSGGNFVGLPLTVLTNGGSASASEIFSGAIRDYKIGTLVGEKTFGKGVVQTMLDTGDGTALKVTVSKYYTPNGENIHHVGIKPDVPVTYPEELRKKAYDRSSDPQFNKALELAKTKVK
ncbi:peptidase S41 [Clostridium carboxidivorans P7]|uniref:Carboxyl-terminal protease n=1 Tax=Clostridium carboxidivorans P7 TaxID=536227 RepID=C6PNJ4_9CLOT|nr:S41 family peptidase [Clostridium carboxidivorans]AKN32874.1 peptidase S41 [Clostridium carboxidivorans P7]EET89121.1 carboxyl-terminal protease [Clostridium carboxidivorans P7]EFG89881.1 peptidase [Clostridium carboxidivorans P7]